MSDLISRSKLHQSIQREESIIVGGKPYVRTDAVLAKISMAPSVDAVEVVQWEESGSDNPAPLEGKCSLCGRYCKRAKYYEYCPHCGAKMDGGAQ